MTDSFQRISEFLKGNIMAQQRKYRTVLIGATFYAAAYASVRPEDCLIVERHSFTGSDFAQSAKQCVIPEKDYAGDAASFREELFRRAVIDRDGNAQMVPFAELLSEYIVKKDLAVLLETEAVSVTKREDGSFTVRLFDRDGFSELLCDRVIDTEAFPSEGCYRTLGLTLLSDGRVPLLAEGERGRFCKTALPDVYIYQLRLSDGDDVTSAHLKLKRLIEETDTFSGMKAVAAANCFAFHYPAPVRTETEDGVWHVPSASFADPLAAMEGGAADALSYLGGR